jgi:hypothetical protein
MRIRQRIPAALRRASLSVLCLVLGAAIVPRHLVGRDAHAWFTDDRETLEALADTVASASTVVVTASAFHTGNARFDGEWAMGTHQMSALGLAQVALAHPELRTRYLPAIDASVARLLDDATFAFATDAWGQGPWASLADDHGHGYLGYVALALGSLRELDPDTIHAAAHDRLVDALVRRIEAQPLGIVQTYPGEAYPCDIAAIVGAIGQHARITGRDRSALVGRMAAVYRGHWIDRDSGYLVQSLRVDGTALDAPRASGTALAAYFWSFADRSLAAELDTALLDVGAASLFGFGGIREYAPGHVGSGDIDSGPVLLGVSVSATGFSLAAARRQGDAARFEQLVRTAALFGIPVAQAGRRRFVTGGPLGNAIMLAMLTARRS